MSAPAWPPRPLAPSYHVQPLPAPSPVPPPSAGAADTPHADVETNEARLIFRDWFDREVSVFARRSHPRHAPNGGAVLHIVGGAQTIHPGDLAVWTDQGYAAASFDWQITGVGNRPPERTSTFPADLVPQHAPTPALSAAVLPVALQAAAVCLDWLARAPGVAPARLGVVGISWGGYLSWLLAAYDSRVRAVVPAFGCGGLFAPGRATATHAPEVQAFWKQHWEPAVLGPRLTAPVCYLNGTNDFFGDPLVADKLLASLAVPHVRHYLPNVDHSLDPAQTRLASAWLRHHLLDGPPLPGNAELQLGSASTWWSDDLDGPSLHRCWLPGLPPAGRPVLAFTHHTTGDLAQSTAISRRTSSIAYSHASAVDVVTRAADGYLPFGLGWRWELGSTRHFNHNASATAPASPDLPWHVSPARPTNTDESVCILIHPARSAIAALPAAAELRLGWSARPSDDVVKIQLHLRAPRPSDPHEGNVVWSDADATLRLAPSAFPTLPPDFTWSAVGRIQLTARQPRAPFTVGPLRP